MGEMRSIQCVHNHTVFDFQTHFSFMLNKQRKII